MRIKTVQDVFQPENDPATKKMCVVTDSGNGPISLCFNNKEEMGNVIKSLVGAFVQNHNIVTFNLDKKYSRELFTECFREAPSTTQAFPQGQGTLAPRPMGKGQPSIDVDNQAPAKKKKAAKKKTVKKPTKKKETK